MSQDEIVLNKELLKAIGADTRIVLLKALRERQKTQSELAQELHLAAPTVLEHLDQLEKAGLVQKLEEGRKWKYYRLTKNAERLLSRQRVHMLVLLGMGLLLAVGFLFLLAKPSPEFLPASSIEASEIPPSREMAVPLPQPLAIESAMDSEQEMDITNLTNQTKNETASLPAS